MFDYHMHTTVSFDGHGSPQGMALAALKAGIKEICFTDHLDYGPPEDKRILTMTYEKTDGSSYEFRFYKHYAASTDTITTGKIFVVVNDLGEFYTTNDLINKIINDTSRVLQGLDVEAYGQY